MFDSFADLLRGIVVSLLLALVLLLALPGAEAEPQRALNDRSEAGAARAVPVP